MRGPISRAGSTLRRFARRARLGLLPLMAALITFPGAACGQAPPSPTGRTPRLFWTPQRQAIWNEMIADTNPTSDGYIWWHRIKDVAEGRRQCLFDQAGVMEALAYQMTGNLTYGRAAWAKVRPYATTLTLPIHGDNGLRIFFIDYDWVYDWIYPALSSTERATFITFLNWMGDSVLGKAPGQHGPGTRTGNANGCIGHYMGLACMALATAGDNPLAGTFLNTTWHDEYGVKPVGGLASTGVNRDTMRNTITQYVSMATGGVWFEGSEYQDASIIPLLMGVEGVRTATGQDYFPEVYAWLSQYAAYEIYQLAPDQMASYQWGDNDFPRDLHMPVRQTIAGEAAGLLQGAPMGPYAQELVTEFEQNPSDYHGGRSPEPPFYLFANPYAAKADWRPVAPPSLFGDGMLLWHDGWAAGASFLGMHMNPRVWVDHGDAVRYQGDFQLYRHGEWAITHPIGYASIGNDGNGTNSMLMAGMSSMQIRGPILEETGADYAYLCGTTYDDFYPLTANWYQPAYYQPPPPYLTEWTRSMVYLPSAARDSDTVVIFDRVNCKDPQQLPKFTHYRPQDQQVIKAAPALQQWCIHSPVTPTLSASGLSWQTPGGQNVQVSTLLPILQSRSVLDELTYVFPVPVNCPSSELKWQTRIVPATPGQWNTFLNVVQVYDSGAVLANALVASVDGSAQGALVQRSGNDDVVVMFGSRESARRLESGYTIAWISVASTTEVFLMDLDPAKSWTVTTPSPHGTFTVSPNGVGRLTISGAGAHTLQLSAN